MIIQKEYQLWKVTSKDKDRRIAIQHISVGHWPISPSYFTEPSHGNAFPGAEGAFKRVDAEDRFCTCLDCQHAHAKANHTPDSPFNQGDLVCKEPATTKDKLGMIGIVYQTNASETRVDYPHLGDLGVRWESTHNLAYVWQRAAKAHDDVPAADMSGQDYWMKEPLEDLMNKYYGVAAATNGWVLAVVPVEIESDADIGMFDANILLQAKRTASRAKDIPIFLRFGKHINGTELVKLSNGHLIPRYHGATEPTSSYPDWTAIIPRRRPKAGENPLGLMTFNITYFSALVDAIGGKQRHTVRAVFAGSKHTEPILLEPIGINTVDEYFRPPMGILMPVHDNPGIDWYRLPDYTEEE